MVGPFYVGIMMMIMSKYGMRTGILNSSKLQGIPSSSALRSATMIGRLVIFEWSAEIIRSASSL